MSTSAGADADSPQIDDERVRSRLNTLRMMRFLSSFALGSGGAVRILHIEAIGVAVAQIGTLFAVYSIVIGVVEVPSGAIADVWGRRRTKLVASAILVVSFGLFVLADDLVLAAIGLALLAVGRALASGAAEAWFVDEVGDPHHPMVLSGLASAEAAHNIGTAVGAVIGGTLPLLYADAVAPDRLFSPVFLLGAGALLFDVTLTLERMDETVPHRSETSNGVWRTTVAGVKNTLDASVPRWVAGVMALLGALTACVELLTPLGLSEGIGADRASVTFGVLVAGSWGMSALTASRASQIERLAGSAARGAAILTVFVVLATLPAAIGLWAAPGLGYIGLNTVGGPLPPLLATVVHRHVASANRSTALSTLNLAVMLGAASGAALFAVLSNGAVVVAGGFGLICAVGLLRAQRRATEASL